MVVLWMSANAAGESGGQPVVIYGTNPSNLQSGTMAQASNTYSIADLCGAPANQSENFLDPGYTHIHLLDGLQLNTTYYYSVGMLDGEKQQWGKVQSFKTSPGIGKDIPARAFLFGDLGIDVPFSTDLEMQPPAVQTIKWIQHTLNKYPNDNWVLNHIGMNSYCSSLCVTIRFCNCFPCPQIGLTFGELDKTFFRRYKLRSRICMDLGLLP